MTLKKYLCFVSLLCILAATPVFTQNAKITQNPKTRLSDPFELKTGSSFFASGSGGGRPALKTSKEIVASDFEDALEIIRKNHADGPQAQYRSAD